MPIDKWPREITHLPGDFIRCWHDGLNCAGSCLGNVCERKYEKESYNQG